MSSQSEAVIQHLSDPHPLHLTNIHNSGFCHDCNACKKQINGFSYRCITCNFDLHITCASMPLSLIHQSHPHQLRLIFTPPYQNKRFTCNICWMVGYNHWLYRCDLCRFDAHLDCIHSNHTPNFPQSTQLQSAPTVPNTLGYQFPTRPPLNNNIYGNYARPFVHGYVNPWTTSLTGQAVQGLVSGACQSLSHIFVNGLLGGDSGSSGGGGDGGNYRDSDGGGNGGNYNYGSGGDGGGDGGNNDYGGSDGGFS